MIKTLSAFVAGALFILSGFASEVEAGRSAALQKSNRRDIHVVDSGCAKQTWPDFSGSCLHGNGADLETRLVGAGRGSEGVSK
jgi:hypothetical protein